ncbi:hypothetical protein T10_5789 [Trichinella papuae]|uniref:Uncharacterized protein n=1 Tax=Trichinella papuae TaxID=268474 RepID=A0A0V1NA12_9BILA|nr:hypothetical protein T10_5789 [Trichinella papuae]
MRSKREEAASKNGMKWHGGAITMRMRKETVLAVIRHNECASDVPEVGATQPVRNTKYT